MAQLNMKKIRYWQYQYELVAEHGLTFQQGVVYAYFYNHCMNINDDGYCGYSDERIAQELNLANSTCRREVKVLKDKGLIIVKNPQKRSKKTGESRMIYINSESYFSKTQTTLQDIENQNLKSKLDAANKKIADLENKLTSQMQSEPSRTSHLGILSVKSGFIPEDVYMDNTDLINGYFEYLLNHTDPFWTKKAIKYFAKVSKGSKIGCYVSYLEKCVTDSILTYQLEQKHQNLEVEFGEYGLMPTEK
ncbi:MAG: hypothetical protein ACRCTZ_21465 [Sarcina sp.]